MKIGIVFKPYATIKEPFRGGMGNFVFLLAKHLNKRGHQVTVLTGRHSHLPSGIKIKKLNFSENQYNIYQAGENFYRQVEKNTKNKREAVNCSFGELSKRFDHKIEAYLQFFADASAQKMDIIHVVTHDILALYSALFSATPAVISFHGHYKILGPDFIHWLKYLKNNRSSKPLALVSVSQYIQKEYNRFIKSRLIYNGIEIKNYQFNKEKNNYLAFLGRIDHLKGLEFAINFSRRYKIPLIIGGRIENQNYFNNLKNKIDGQFIKFIGPQNEKQKNQFLGRAKALIMCSHYAEAFGRVTAEALACGTPIIAFNKGANSELVINNKTGFLIKENDLTGAKRAWDKIDQINPLTCRHWAEKNFNIENQVVAYEKLYQNLVTNKK